MPTVAVVAGTLLCFSDKVAQQAQNDVIRSMLFAQSAADQKISRISDFSGWGKRYTTALDRVGWYIGDEHPTPLPVGNLDNRTNVEQAVLANRSGLFDDLEVSTLQSAMNSLRQHDDAIRLFDTKAMGGDPERKTAVFHIVVCRSADEHGADIKMASYIFTTSVSMDHVLSSSLTNSGVIFSESSQQTKLNLRIFEQVREDIEQKLGDKTQSDVVVFSI